MPELAFGLRWLPPEDRSAPPEVEDTQSNHADISGTALGAHSTQLENGQSGPRNTPDPEQWDAGSPAGVSAKGAEPPSEHPADRGGNTPAGPSDADGVWNAAAAPTLTGGETPAAVPAQQANQARPADGEPPEPAAPPVSHDVALHLADGQSSVDIRMAEHAGEIRVTVHTPDHDLASSLRADLPDLVGKLRQNGFQAEAWRPAAATQSEGGRRNAPDGWSSQQHSPGARKDGRQRQPQPQQPKNQSRWAGEWKSTLDPAQEFHK
jgi:hypothetical protein